MRKLMRRLSRVADSSQYTYLGSSSGGKRGSGRGDVPEGHLPVYVGEEMQRFIVNAELLNHPIFVKLLNKSAQEYGYDQEGALKIPCHVFVFERVLEALRLGVVGGDVQDLINSLS